MKKIVSIDPGLGGTGWALFNVDAEERAVMFDSADTIHGTPAKHWEGRQDKILARLYKVLRKHKPSEVYIEMPFYAPSKEVVARAGSLVKLCLLAGRVFEVAKSVKSVRSVAWVPVIEWKGQTSKKVTDIRLAKRLPHVDIKSFSEHARDAIGIGLYACGVY